MPQPTTATIKRLFAVSHDQCAFPKCGISIVDPESGKVTGRICHIKAQSQRGPRYDSGQTDEERYSFDNLILLCPIHHDVIDSDETSYTVERLRQIKAEHELGPCIAEPSDEVVRELVAVSNVVAGGSVITSVGQSGGQIAHSITNIQLAESGDISSLSGQATEVEPDILLESSSGLIIKRNARDSLEAADLIAYNDGATTAMDVKIATLSSGNYESGFWGGDNGTPAGPVYVSTTIRFDPIPHLEGKKRAVLTPINPTFSLQEKILQHAGATAGLWWFVDRSRDHRAHEEAYKTAEADRPTVITKLRKEPIDIPVRVTYSNSQRTRQWERLETLHYDPTTLSAYIAHGEKRELPKAAPENNPFAVVKLICDQDRAEIVVKNEGLIADFWGTLQIKGPVRLFQDTDLFCRWSHTASVRSRIAKGQESRIILADRRPTDVGGMAHGFSRWYIYALSRDRLITVESAFDSTPVSTPVTAAPDIVLEGTIVADPDLANGIQRFRVILKPFEAVAD